MGIHKENSSSLLNIVLIVGGMTFVYLTLMRYLCSNRHIISESASTVTKIQDSTLTTEVKALSKQYFYCSNVKRVRTLKGSKHNTIGEVRKLLGMN